MSVDLRFFRSLRFRSRLGGHTRTHEHMPGQHSSSPQLLLFAGATSPICTCLLCQEPQRWVVESWNRLLGGFWSSRHLSAAPSSCDQCWTWDWASHRVSPCPGAVEKTEEIWKSGQFLFFSLFVLTLWWSKRVRPYLSIPPVTQWQRRGCLAGRQPAQL